MRIREVLLRELNKEIMEATHRWMLMLDRFGDSVVFPALWRLTLVAMAVESTRFALVVYVAWKTVRRGVSGPFYLVGTLEIVLFVWNFFSDYEGAQLMERLSNTPINARYLASSIMTHFCRFLYITLLFWDSGIRSGGRGRRLNTSVAACVVGAFAVTYALEHWPLHDAPHHFEIGMADMPWYLQRKLPQSVKEADAILAYTLTRILHFYMFTESRF